MPVVAAIILFRLDTLAADIFPWVPVSVIFAPAAVSILSPDVPCFVTNKVSASERVPVKDVCAIASTNPVVFSSINFKIAKSALAPVVTITTLLAVIIDD